LPSGPECDNGRYDLDELPEPDTGWELIQPFGINNRGEIGGIGTLEAHDRIRLAPA